ncbi:MAG: glycosyltransferase [Pedobacter sp.]
MELIFAVLICLYRGDKSKWFQQSIDSIVAQTVGFKNIRIYLGVDGPIGDELEDYIAHHEGVFYKICRNSQNLGLTKTLNKLIKNLENEEYIFRLDADDYCVPDRFEKQVIFLHQHPEVEVLGGGIIEIDCIGRKVYQRNYPLNMDLIKKTIHKGNPLAHSTICFRKSFFKKIKMYPEWATYNQDLALWFQGIKNGVIFSNITEPLVYMRVDNDFYQRRRKNRALSELKIYFRGIYELHGLSYKYIFPLARLLLRLSPSWVVKCLYSSSLRNKLNP